MLELGRLRRSAFHRAIQLALEIQNQFGATEWKQPYFGTRSVAQQRESLQENATLL